MYVPPNDLFLSPQSAIQLFTDSDPVSGDVTDAFGLFDAGTELNGEGMFGLIPSAVYAGYYRQTSTAYYLSALHSYHQSFPRRCTWRRLSRLRHPPVYLWSHLSICTSLCGCSSGYPQEAHDDCAVLGRVDFQALAVAIAPG
jgi:hypothetical protein